MSALELAIFFHDTYERLAPQFGYVTRLETLVFDPTTPNGRLMIAVCNEVLEHLTMLEVEAEQRERGAMHQDD